MISTDLRLLRAPAATYRECVAQTRASQPPALSIFVRAALPAGIAGIATAIAATGRITWSLALSGAICWSFVSLVQLTTAVAVVAPGVARAELGRAIELFFLGHAAWSLWLIAVAALLPAAPVIGGLDVVLYTGCVPFAWTSVIVFAFFRQVLHLDRRRAAFRTVIHQALTVVAIVIYVAWAVQLWPRILSVLSA